MGRASRRKRANGGDGFYRRQHLLAAIDSYGHGEDPPVAVPPAITPDDGLEQLPAPPQDMNNGVADIDDGNPAAE